MKMDLKCEKKSLKVDKWWLKKLAKHVRKMQNIAKHHDIMLKNKSKLIENLEKILKISQKLS